MQVILGQLDLDELTRLMRDVPPNVADSILYILRRNVVQPAPEPVTSE